MPTVPKAKSDSDIDHSGFDIDNCILYIAHLTANG